MNSMSSIITMNRTIELTARTYVFVLATNYASFTIDWNPPPSPCPNIFGDEGYSCLYYCIPTGLTTAEGRDV